MSSQSMPFSYPSLPAGVDAIRVLTVTPGDFVEPLVCTLTPVAFGEKPKYVALSYTWENPYPDTSQLPLPPNDARMSPRPPGMPAPGQQRNPIQTTLPEPRTGTMTDPRPPHGATHASQTTPSGSQPNALVLEGQSFPVGHNLHLALQHLRSPTHPITLWVDAICINQKDIKERNQQVALMAFVYSRAIMVLAWLGPKAYPSRVDVSRYMSREWRAGRTGHFVAALAGAGKLRTSLKPNMGIFARMAESSYWTRLWIVQELRLSPQLAFVHGSDIWTYEEFRQWDFLSSTKRDALPQSVFNGYEAMEGMLEAREKKHTDMRTLESLVERFATSGCRDPKDRVYGLLGCAKDARPYTEQTGTADIQREYISLPTDGSKTFPEPRRGHGSFRVDYGCSFYDLWARMIRFVFYARIVEGRDHIRVGESGTGEHAADGKPEDPVERRISIVRTSGVIQGALEQKVDEEVAMPGHSIVGCRCPYSRRRGP